MGYGLQRQALRRGARIMGGAARLCALLDAAPDSFLRWMDGAEAMPAPLFAMLLDLLADMESDKLLPH